MNYGVYDLELLGCGASGNYELLQMLLASKLHDAVKVNIDFVILQQQA